MDPLVERAVNEYHGLLHDDKALAETAAAAAKPVSRLHRGARR